MFILSSFSDLVIVDPEDFSKRTVDALEDQINAKYANKVVYNLGLCIALYDIQRVTEGMVSHGSGSAHVTVEFRLVVFRPFKGEVLTGRISSSSHHGINVRTDFFDEIFIPDTYLFEGTTYDVKENVWVWNNDGNQFYMDKNEVIRFRVEEEAFEDQLPVPPHLLEGSREVERKPPYRIIVSSPR
ncbi:RNA polymerase III subunit Rpc25-domain-containing protein [Sphaerosporella brunnea]|uniref:DNA-directed RNA polymerase subunit n=1 Tax=Sphaerosporella brunnea TaxID=1250544 RepID=A0A5J5EMN9_9PEZI|nr:RNA polymerase III subunit Rpc25-domain-containing protein [Sphaerosporella brunnea]